MARRVLTVGFAAVCFQPLYNSGRVGGAGSATARTTPSSCSLLLVLTALCDAVLAAAARRAPAPAGPYGPLLRDELRALLGIGSAVCATGAVMALGVAVAGLWALPVFCVPLLLTQLSFRRYAAVRTTYRQTIASLARATEIAGYTPHGPRPPGRRAQPRRRAGAGALRARADRPGVRGADARHRPALPRRPGAGRGHRPAAGRRAAPDRAARRGGRPPDRGGRRVAVVVERQADPYREQPLPARIVRAVNAYDDLAGGKRCTRAAH